jgi:DNA-binding NarL/FixJ family response regulator
MEDISICIVEDNKELRHALEEVLSMSHGFNCISSIGSAEEALRLIPLLNPDVVLMDINLGGEESGIDCVRELKPRMPRTNFMMCTIYEESEKIFEALSAGASGYVLKKTTPSKMLESIRELYHGGSPMSSLIARKVVAAFQQNTTAPHYTDASDLSNLSPREKEILDLLSKGMMYKEIASALDISVETIRKHAYRIYEKLQVSNRVQAVNKMLGR